jgi:hypothetical protein
MSCPHIQFQGGNRCLLTGRLNLRSYTHPNYSPLTVCADLRNNPRSLYERPKALFFDVNFKEVDAKQSLELYEQALTHLSQMSPSSSVSFDQWLPVVTNSDTDQLGKLFAQHGSDKSTSHDYHVVYGSVLSGKRDAAFNILEIGLGTNNIDVPSNMGLGGKPGASLRAFRDWAPHAHIYGADVDRRILFEEDRITTSWVDQTDRDSLARLRSSMGDKRFDLIIDDGLHLPHANINTLDALLPLLSEDGIFVIEDINGYFPFWTAASRVLNQRYETFFTARKSASIFVVRHAPNRATK